MNGIRTLSVMAVILFHDVHPWFPGPMGVQVFFVLSGFLITHLMLDERQRTGTVSLSRFYKRRARRILPALYFYLAVAALVFSINAHWWASALYAANYYEAVTNSSREGFGHLWSLAVEEQFYLLWPLVFLRFHRNLHTLACLTGSAILLVQIHKAVLYSAGMHVRYLYAAFDSRGSEILVGCFLAILIRLVPPFRIGRIAIAGSLAMLAATAVSMVAAPREAAVFLYLPNCVAIAILLIRAVDKPPAWLNSAVMSWVGAELSYALYIWHPLAYHVAQDSAVRYRYMVPLSIALAFAMAVGSRYLIERPVLGLRRHERELQPCPAGD